MRSDLPKEEVGLLVTRREIGRMEVERKGSIVGYLRLLYEEELLVCHHDRFPIPNLNYLSRFSFASWELR